MNGLDEKKLLLLLGKQIIFYLLPVIPQIVSLNSEKFINKKKILYFPTPVETRKRKKMEERLLIRRKIFKNFL